MFCDVKTCGLYFGFVGFSPDPSGQITVYVLPSNIIPCLASFRLCSIYMWIWESMIKWFKKERYFSLLTEFVAGSMSQGIYRRSGANSNITRLLALFRQDAWAVQLTRQEYSEYDVASVVKRFLRDLPEPLLTTELNSPLCEIAGMSYWLRMPHVTVMMHLVRTGNAADFRISTGLAGPVEMHYLLGWAYRYR